MSMRKRLALVLAAVLVCVCCTGCSTSAFTNSSLYFTEVGQVLHTWFGTNAGSVEETDSTPKLDVPGSFTLSADGSYSFTGVENADYYLVYFCAPDAKDDKDPFLFSSDALKATGTGGETYSGNVNDLIGYGYGEYLVKVFAFPNLNDSNHAMSAAATADFSCSGAQDAPAIDYLWNTFTGTVEVQLSNVNDYTYQVYPDKVEVTFTNVADSSDTVVVTIESPNPGSYSAVSDQLTRGAVYDIQAVSYSSSSYCTNAVSDTAAVGEGIAFDSENIVTEHFSYTDNIARSSYSYPQVTEKLDLAAGGALNDSTHVINFTFTATPTAARDGALYSYPVAANHIFAYDNATLDLYADGTFHMETYTEMPPEGPTSIEGIWVDNGDGTATLSWNHDTIVFTTAAK